MLSISMLNVPGVGIAFLLVIIALVGGIGITTIGPGGIFVTITLYTLTPHSPSAIAGTTSAALLAAGILGTAVYGRSGELFGREERPIAIVTSLSAGLGAFMGSQFNALISQELFGSIVAGFVLLVSLNIGYRELRGFQPLVSIDPHSWLGMAAFAGIGIGVGFPSGLVGVGGPILAVPALVLVGVPLLPAVATSQLLSIFVTGAATSGYLLRGAVNLPLFLLIAPALLTGVVIGWHVAHRIEAVRLRRILAIVLFAVGVYLLS